MVAALLGTFSHLTTSQSEVSISCFVISVIFVGEPQPHVILDLVFPSPFRSLSHPHLEFRGEWSEKRENEMKLNEKLVIYGTRVILVPYDKEHVEKYHGWMQNKDILEATASGLLF